jgi:hypothetical protein
LEHNGKMRVISLTQLAPRTEDFVITDSATGNELTVTLRDLMPDQIAYLDARVKRPKPPISGFKSGGVPIFNEDDPTYIEQRELANNQFVYEWLAESLVLEYPAGVETHEQKVESLKATLPFWVFNELGKRLREINGLKMSDVALEKKRSKQTTSGDSSTAPAPSGDGPSPTG